MKLAPLAVLVATGAPMCEATEAPPGTRVELSVGQLFVPEGYRPTAEGIHLVLHLHGAAGAAERNLARSGWNAVVASVILPGLSQAYTERFAKRDTFGEILRETRTKLRELGVAKDPTLARVTVTSFSAGFGGVRELLKSEDGYRRLDALVLADSIHAGFVGDPAKRQVDPKAMSGFLRFARDAAAGRKTMVVSHSAIKPANYASTTETADYLLAQLGGKRESVDELWAEGLHCTSRFRRGRLRIFGFTGETGPDHMKHLHHLWRLMRRAEG